MGQATSAAALAFGSGILDYAEMLSVLGHMAALIAFGVLWRASAPMGLAADEVRRAISSLVLILLLPALVLQVLWRAPIGISSLWISGIAALCVLAAIALSGFIYRRWGVARPVVGTLILAASWPNATYLGLPVLEQTLGEWARSVAIHYDLFACTPLLLSLGAYIASSHGDSLEEVRPVRALLRVPPLWAALVGVALNLTGVAMPVWVEGLLGMMAPAVAPLMLIALGMGLRWDTLRPGQLLLFWPVALIQLLLMPLLALGVARAGGLESGLVSAVVLESAMPAMVLGMVLCDRYRLEPGLYAGAVTVSTVLSMLTLPLWLRWLGG